MLLNFFVKINNYIRNNLLDPAESIINSIKSSLDIKLLCFFLILFHKPNLITYIKTPLNPFNSSLQFYVHIA